eukprot:TRINITY_DN2569_c0_g2_i3.p1 TRINITY_DN2569_c0_g2~~TRINITY_DN2569_c0_g2_i3.p1  ORF type:complete len:284 (+),score=65.26 TRINITY_DN2569_c0_g2_i3:85-936(+)
MANTAEIQEGIIAAVTSKLGDNTDEEQQFFSMSQQFKKSKVTGEQFVQYSIQTLGKEIAGVVLPQIILLLAKFPERQEALHQAIEQTKAAMEAQAAGQAQDRVQPSSGMDPDNRAGSLRLATYNVLKPSITECIVAADKRFPYILSQLLPSLHADVIGLNEVTRRFELAAMELSRGELIVDPTSNQEHYCALLCHIPVLERHTFRLPQTNRRAVAAMVCKAERRFIVCAVHLLAYERNTAARQAQLSSLSRVLDEGEGCSDEWRGLVQTAQVRALRGCVLTTV